MDRSIYNAFVFVLSHSEHDAKELVESVLEHGKDDMLTEFILKIFELLIGEECDRDTIINILLNKDLMYSTKNNVYKQLAEKVKEDDVLRIWDLKINHSIEKLVVALGLTDEDFELIKSTKNDMIELLKNKNISVKDIVIPLLEKHNIFHVLVTIAKLVADTIANFLEHPLALIIDIQFFSEYETLSEVMEVVMKTIATKVLSGGFNAEYVEGVSVRS